MPIAGRRAYGYAWNEYLLEKSPVCILNERKPLNANRLNSIYFYRMRYYVGDNILQGRADIDEGISVNSNKHNSNAYSFWFIDGIMLRDRDSYVEAHKALKRLTVSNNRYDYALAMMPYAAQPIPLFGPMSGEVNGTIYKDECYSFIVDGNLKYYEGIFRPLYSNRHYEFRYGELKGIQEYTSITEPVEKEQVNSGKNNKKSKKNKENKNVNPSESSYEKCETCKDWETDSNACRTCSVFMSEEEPANDVNNSYSEKMDLFEATFASILIDFTEAADKIIQDLAALTDSAKADGISNDDLLFSKHAKQYISDFKDNIMLFNDLKNES